MRSCRREFTRSAVAAAACNNNHPNSSDENQRTGGGAVMPHALINRTTDVRAEAESSATNLIRFCAVHPSQE